MGIKQVEGKLVGLKASQIRALERIYRRRIPQNEIITKELARYLTELSLEIQRQIGIIIDRNGDVCFVIVGDATQIVIPDLSRWRTGRGRLRGLRCIHTHLKEEPLSQDDLTDLALLRLDLMASIGVGKDGLPSNFSMAYILPANPKGELWKVENYDTFYEMDINFLEFIETVEEEIEKSFTAYEVDGREKAILVSVVPKRSNFVIEDSLTELKELCRTAGLEVIDTIIQRPPELNPKYLMGSGKAKELMMRAQQTGADIIIFDQNLTPVQAEALAELTDLKVIDRTQLILDIFARHATTKEGKLKIELAQLRYTLPRLVGRGIAMSRLVGGIGGRGPGETKLEIDRRRIRERIRKIEQQLKELADSASQRRKLRLRTGIPIVSIVGYTNVGKSTLLNALSKSHVAVEDKLFVTLDTTSRRVRFPNDREVIITDTVGFIRNLPKDLFDAFRSTLEELHYADLLLHVIDISNPCFVEQMQEVENLLKKIQLEQKPILRVFNKMDLLEENLAHQIAHQYNGVAVSALQKTTLMPLLQRIEEIIWNSR